jgi:hypothetical protein
MVALRGEAPPNEGNTVISGWWKPGTCPGARLAEPRGGSGRRHPPRRRTELDDPHLTDLVGELSLKGAAFRQIWSAAT